MPLIKSSSSKAVGENIKREEAAGRPYKQALAIALSTQDRAKGKKRGRKMGTTAHHLHKRSLKTS